MIDEARKQSPEGGILFSVIDEDRLFLRRRQAANGMRDLAEHARAERAIPQSGNDITDGMTLAQIQRAQFFELHCFHVMFSRLAVGNSQLGGG